MPNRFVNKLCRINQRLELYTPQINEFCFLIGAMKSGTTTLYRYLVQHPQILPNRFRKEPEFFSKSEAPDDFSHFYRQYLKLPFTRQIALDGSTGASKMPAFPDVAHRLTALPGKKHFLHILRDPIERIESHIAHNLASGELSLEEVTEDAFNHRINVSRYAYQLDAFRAAFPLTPVHLYDFNDLKRNPLGLLQRICGDLGLAQGFAFRELAPKNTRSRENVTRHFKLNEAQIEQLRTVLRPDVLRLREEYGFNVSDWSVL